MNFQSTTTMIQDPGSPSVFDSILDSVRAGIDAWKSGGADVGGNSGAQGQTSKAAPTSGGTDLVFLVLLVAVVFMVAD